MSDKRTETCCCTGHRDIPYGLETPLKSVLKEQVGLLLSKGVIYYGVGGAVGFDTLAAEALFELRTEYPQIKVILVYPFSGFDSRWQEEQRERYRVLLPKYDKPDSRPGGIPDAGQASCGLLRPLYRVLFTLIRRDRLYCALRTGAWVSDL